MIDFTEANLANADLSGSWLTARSRRGDTTIDFAKTNLTNADLSGSKLTATFSRNSREEDAGVSTIDFTEADLANVSGSMLTTDNIIGLAYPPSPSQPPSSPSPPPPPPPSPSPPPPSPSPSPPPPSPPPPSPLGSRHVPVGEAAASPSPTKAPAVCGKLNHGGCKTPGLKELNELYAVRLQRIHPIARLCAC